MAARRVPKLTLDEVREIYEQYRQGKTLTELAEEYGVSVPYLSRRIKEYERAMAVVKLGENAGKGNPGDVAGSLEAARAAKRGVITALAGKVEEEAMSRTQAYLQVGEAVVKAYLDYVTRRGIPLEQALNADIASIVTEALSKLDDYDRMKQRLKLLEEQVKLLSEQVDPIKRLERAIDFMAKFMEFAVLCKKLFGINIARTPIGLHYLVTLHMYLTGEYDLYGEEVTLGE